MNLNVGTNSRACSQSFTGGVLENSFTKWMKQPGIIKQLQLFLTLSLLLNVALAHEMIGSKLKKPSPVQQQVLEAEAGIHVTEEALRDFVTNYLEAFFSVTDEAFDLIESHTERELFVLELKPEITKRKELSLESHFELDDIYLDSFDSQHAKAVALGREIFNGDYMDRNLTIELVINVAELKIKAIPVFKVQ